MASSFPEIKTELPDIVLLAKVLASGLPLRAVISKKKYIGCKLRIHGIIFGDNP